MKPIYEPKGRAKEYGDYALNIYTGCPHRCFYCFAPNVLHRNKEAFHSHVEPRNDIINETLKQLEREGEVLKDKLIHLCFTCDPYPTGYDTTTTREIIKLIKSSGNHVQILTKGDGTRDFDLLDNNDWYGITLDGDDTGPYYEDSLINDLIEAKKHRIKTWVSFEPVLNDYRVLWYLENCSEYFDKVKIGKLNYHPSDIDWKEFGKRAEQICKENRINYYIKESLRKEINK